MNMIRVHGRTGVITPFVGLGMRVEETAEELRIFDKEGPCGIFAADSWDWYDEWGEDGELVIKKEKQSD